MYFWFIGSWNRFRLKRSGEGFVEHHHWGMGREYSSRFVLVSYMIGALSLGNAAAYGEYTIQNLP